MGTTISPISQSEGRISHLLWQLASQNLPFPLIISSMGWFQRGDKGRMVKFLPSPTMAPSWADVAGKGIRQPHPTPGQKQFSEDPASCLAISRNVLRGPIGNSWGTCLENWGEGAVGTAWYSLIKQTNFLKSLQKAKSANSWIYSCLAQNRQADFWETNTDNYDN